MKKVILVLFLILAFVSSSVEGSFGNSKHPLYKVGSKAYKLAEKSNRYGRFDARYQVPKMPLWYEESWRDAAEKGDWDSDACQFGCGWVDAQSQSYNSFAKAYKYHALKEKESAGVSITNALRRHVGESFQAALEIAEQKQLGYEDYRNKQEENVARGASVGQPGYVTPLLLDDSIEKWERDSALQNQGIRLSNEYYYVEGWGRAQQDFIESIEAVLGDEDTRKLFEAVGLRD